MCRGTGEFRPVPGLIDLVQWPVRSSRLKGKIIGSCLLLLSQNRCKRSPMTGPLRTQDARALYQVISCANARHVIFRDDFDRKRFFNFLRRVTEDFCWLWELIVLWPTTVGIQEYLVRLIICETLRLRNASFLKFLISGATDIEDCMESQGNKAA